MARFDIKDLARRGAATRVQELTAELAEIYRAFPDLRSGRATSRQTDDGQTLARRGRGGRRSMNAAQRKEVSQRMKKYWAERRKAKAAAGKPAAQPKAPAK